MSALQPTAWRKVLVSAGIALLILICIALLVMWILMATFTLAPAG